MYLSLIKDFDIPWFIFSDGEAAAIQAVNSAVQNVFGLDASVLSNVVILENGDDYEDYLIREGYTDFIIEAICEHEEDTAFFDSYIQQMNGKKCKGGKTRNYSIASGRDDALLDLCHEHKTEYALPVAKKLIEKGEQGKKIPRKVEMLLSTLANKIGAVEAPVVEDGE